MVTEKYLDNASIATPVFSILQSIYIRDKAPATSADGVQILDTGAFRPLKVQFESIYPRPDRSKAKRLRTACCLQTPGFCPSTYQYYAVDEIFLMSVALFEPSEGCQLAFRLSVTSQISLNSVYYWYSSITISKFSRSNETKFGVAVLEMANRDAAMMTGRAVDSKKQTPPMTLLNAVKQVQFTKLACVSLVKQPACLLISEFFNPTMRTL